MADFWKRFSRNRQAVLGLIILCIVIFMAAIANIIYPGDPFLYSKFPLSAPGENGFLLGSDSIGRDVASGIAHGAKTSLLIGLIATLAAVFIGVIFGNVEKRVGGLGDIKDLIAGYESNSDIKIDESQLDVWQLYGSLRWGVICMMQTFAHLSGMVNSVEKAAIGRRVSETEFDLMNMIKHKNFL